MTTIAHQKTFSVASIIAVISAFLSFTSGAVLGMFFALVAIVTGLIGISLALSPRKRGGIASTLAIAGGVIGVLAAIIKAFLWIV